MKCWALLPLPGSHGESHGSEGSWSLIGPPACLSAWLPTDADSVCLRWGRDGDEEQGGGGPEDGVAHAANEVRRPIHCHVTASTTTITTTVQAALLCFLLLKWPHKNTLFSFCMMLTLALIAYKCLYLNFHSFAQIRANIANGCSECSHFKRMSLQASKVMNVITLKLNVRLVLMFYFQYSKYYWPELWQFRTGHKHVRDIGRRLPAYVAFISSVRADFGQTGIGNLIMSCRNRRRVYFV